LIRLVLADDHPLLLDGLEHLFRHEPEFEIVARCGNGETALAAVRLHRPDVLVLDFKMPDRDGFSVVREMQQDAIAPAIVLLTAAVNENEVTEAVRMGIRGIVLKEVASQVLVQAVREVHAGGQWLERRSVGRALEKMVRRETGERELAAVLTPREIELVRMVASGLRNKEIARRLSITEGTVKTHLHNIYDKLAVGGRLELTLHAQNRGLL
jgi:DNA-binding NarL/FixJ family response regulator